MLVYSSDDDPKYGPKLVAFVLNCIRHNGNAVDAFNDLSTIAIRHLKT